MAREFIMNNQELFSKIIKLVRTYDSVNDFEITELIMKEIEKKCLEESKECKVMWEAFKEKYKNKPLMREYYSNGVCKPYTFIKDLMEEFEKKYFKK